MHKLNKNIYAWIPNIKQCIYKLTKFFYLFLSIRQQRGEGNQTNKYVYAIYIHEEEDTKLASLHTCITWRRDDKS